MNHKLPLLCSIGVALGGIALLLATIHFYAGPFSPQQSLEEQVAQKAVAIKDATIAALKGEQAPVVEKKSEFDLDRITHIIVSVLGTLAVILAAAGMLKGEPLRGAVGAAGLGVLGIGFQFMTIALGAILFVILVGTVLSSFTLE